MLQIIKTDSPTNKNKLIRELFSKESATLVVSDLQSKLYWQSELNGTAQNTKVLRASELWQILIKKTEPNLHILNDQATLIHLQIKMDQYSNTDYAELKIKKIKPRTFMGFFFELFPLFSHPNTSEIMHYWFEEQRQSNPIYWEPIFYLCRNIWKQFKQDNLLPERVISSYLLNILNYENQWKTPLVFDLGGNLQTTESELILTLSQQIKTTVIEPDPEWIKDFHWISWPYKQLKTRSYQELSSKKTVETKHNIENSYYRFPSPLSEIKMIMSQIQIWISQGISLQKIYITAPKIEDYWPALKWHLDNANIKYNKEISTQLIDLLPFKKLISQLKCSYLRSTEKQELESAIFINADEIPLKYTEFSNLYSELFSVKDYFRNQRVSEKLKLTTNSAELSTDEFLKIIIEFYSNPEGDKELVKNNQLLDEIKNEIESSSPYFQKLEIKYWIYYLESILQKKELLTSANSSQIMSTDVINITPLPSIFALTDCYIIFLGLNESDLKSNGNTISGSDVMSLLNKTGHLLNHPDRNYFDFLLQWSQLNRNGFIYSFAETNWKTEDLTPSVFWLLGNAQSLGNSLSLDNSQFFNQENKAPEKILELAFPRNTKKDFKPDLRTEFQIFNTPEVFKTLSPSGLEKLNDCAFKYYTERVLGLTEERILDLDPSPMTLGNLYHKLCELLTTSPMYFTLQDDQWNKIIESTLNSIKSHELMDFQKAEIKKNLTDWGKSFLSYEEDWRKNHPESRVFGREIKFYGEIKNIKFIGKIDRIDWDQKNNYSIIDYKSSVSYLSGPLSWIKNNQLQILCYIYAAKNGWITHPEYQNNNPIEISGAYYLSLKNFEKKGFTLTECNNTFLSPLSSRSQLSNETLSEILGEFEELLMKSIDKLKLGNIEPIPRDEKICHECSWRHLCRAPHLNT
jgi:hypothetical protein